MISGVFAMSGTPLSAFAVDAEPKHTYVNMTTLLGCSQLTSIEAVRCLQKLSIQNILNSDSKYQVCVQYLKFVYIYIYFIIFCIYFLEYKTI